MFWSVGWIWIFEVGLLVLIRCLLFVLGFCNGIGDWFVCFMRLLL